jgi:hypothetical protein
MGYSDLSLLELKVMCKERGLMVSGKKDDVIIRLMENDEAKAPHTQMIGNISTQNTHTIPLSGVTERDTSMMVLGIGIMIYSIFRAGVGLIWLTSGTYAVASLIAIAIGGAFMAGGLLTTMNYKNGLLMTLLVLVFSGLLSLIATPIFGYGNPLSVDFGNDEITKMFSLMCSATCFIIAGVPIMVNKDSMKPGFPPGLEDLFSPQHSTNNSNQSVSKITYECPSCSQSLRAPSTFSGIAKCPKCKQEMEI